jgi:predicted RNase H-like HicB family nuclease
MNEREGTMDKKLTMIYWKGDKFWLGKFIEYPEIMTQGETVEELEDNLRDAYVMMVMEDVPQSYKTKRISV